ncbi:MAG TPA: GNAT family N-acetyltransferase [Anaerolineales bacterium]|nr:GNAT family N-acetyltransferase [Anaerolineales bacterium]
MTSFDIHLHHSIHDIEPALWDRLSAGCSFQSHRWYAFGERAMADCRPTYLIVQQDDKLLAAAVLFKIHNEPLPLPHATRRLLEAYFRRKPMLICRSPLADAPGLILPEGPLRAQVLTLLTNAARQELERERGSFLLFDFLSSDEVEHWTPGFSRLTLAAPGTSMTLTHESFEAYLAANKRTRNDYYHTLRKAKENDLHLRRCSQVENVDAALELIQRVAQKHNSLPNPWTRGMLENLSMIDATWFEVHQKGKMVGCIVTMRDNGVQIATALGLAGIPFTYFMLIYATIQEAFEQGVKQFRLGSGAYEVKRRLGFQIENTNHVMAEASALLPKILMKFASK